MLDVRTSYRPMRHPAHAGEVRSKRWGIEFWLGPETVKSQLWLKRCQEYWQRQQMLYGLEFGTFSMKITPPMYGQPGVVTTTAQVVRVLPGERVHSMMGAN